ncbi:hypothetical protein RJT34_13424 [Clitoria ternatea]|uniref:C2H2-type domain-containing protein n=1 Tax=Clitoria ternatea TaxID=43366 RepID=A0AAN9JNX4_CLITE
MFIANLTINIPSHVKAKMASMNETTALKLESIASIDSTTLSHSELLALSLSSFHLPSTLLTPKIDPSIFNESTGSRRQTYSRPHSSPTARRRRIASLLPAPSHDSDNRLIIDYLKHLIREDPHFDQVEFAPPPRPPDSRPEPDVASGERKRKRGRKPKAKVHLEDCYRGMEILNKNGVSVDLSALAKAEDPFADELRRRTEGLRSEEELLGFLSDLPGQWGSRRKKRRIVDSSDFGDVLPLRWKLLLGLKRKDGRAWIYCRRYISPSGQQFVSCKEVSSYLQSLLGHGDAQLQIGGGSENVVQEVSVTTEDFAGVTHEDQDQSQIVAANSDVPGLSDANERVKEVALLGIENLADVQIHDLFECHKCSMNFDEKNAYLQHLLSFHQRTTRRYRLGSSVGDGVIIKDGKFECQFCHKVFLERRRYNGHVGIHVRNYVRRVEDLPGQETVQGMDKSPVREDGPLRISRMDALIEIAQNSIMENSVTELNSSAKLNDIPASEIALDDSYQDRNSDSPLSEQQMEDSLTGINAVHDSDGNEEEIDDDDQMIDAKMVTFLDNMGLLSVNKENFNASETSKEKDDVALTVDGFDQSGIDLDGVSCDPLPPLSGDHIIPESDKSGNSGCSITRRQFKLNEDDSNRNELKIGLVGLKDVPVSTNVLQEVVMRASHRNVGGKQFCSVDHEHDNVKGFQELRFEEIDTIEYDFARVQDSPLPDAPTEYASSVQFESQEVLPNVDSRNQLTAVCVWCGIDFNHDAVNDEIQPDSVGFMCPACKEKVSGQINVLDCGSPNAGHL